MQLRFYFAPMLSLFAGIVLLVMPRILHYIVAIFLILTGVTGLFGVHRIRCPIYWNAGGTGRADHCRVLSFEASNGRRVIGVRIVVTRAMITTAEKR